MYVYLYVGMYVFTSAHIDTHTYTTLLSFVQTVCSLKKALQSNSNSSLTIILCAYL